MNLVVGLGLCLQLAPRCSARAATHRTPRALDIGTGAGRPKDFSTIAALLRSGASRRVKACLRNAHGGSTRRRTPKFDTAAAATGAGVVRERRDEERDATNLDATHWKKGAARVGGMEGRGGSGVECEGESAWIGGVGG